MTIALTTPSQINMWVLLSRRHQLQLQLKGMKTNGLVKWCKANIPGCENARTAKQCVVPVEYAISEAGGTPDYKIVNLHVMRHHGGLFLDRGIVNSDKDIAANPQWVKLYEKGMLELVFTLEDVREPNGQAYVAE